MFVRGVAAGMVWHPFQPRTASEMATPQNARASACMSRPGSPALTAASSAKRARGRCRCRSGEAGRPRPWTRVWSAGARTPTVAATACIVARPSIPWASRIARPARMIAINTRRGDQPDRHGGSWLARKDSNLRSPDSESSALSGSLLASAFSAQNGPIRGPLAHCFRVSQVPIRKRIRGPSEKPDESGATWHQGDSSAGTDAFKH